MQENKDSLLYRILNKIEIAGNKLPHPFWLFVYLSIFIVILSVVLSSFDVSYTFMKITKNSTAAPVETTETIVNLLGRKSLSDLFTNFTKIYTSFAPLGLVLVMMLGVGFLEKTGMIEVFIKKTIVSAPVYLLTAIVALLGINANLASDAGIILVPAIAGSVFYSMGLNPWIGIITGYAAAFGGFSANLFVAGTDALLSGITKSVAAPRLQDSINVLINWYYMVAATFMIVACTMLVNKFYLNKKLGGYSIDKATQEQRKESVTEQQKKALRYSGFAALVFIIFIAGLCIPKDSFFRNPTNGSLFPNSPLLHSVIAILFFLFFIMAMVYGKVAGTIKNSKDVPILMQEAVRGVLSFVVVALPAAIFIHLFNESRIANYIGVVGGELLAKSHMNTLVLILFYILMVCFINLFMVSGSAKWLLLAPIFVPLFSQLGLNPAATQLAYRIADSSTNIISPVSYYLPVIIGLMETYKPKEYQDREVGMGTVISLCIPYSVTYLIGLILLFAVFYVFNLPIGPATYIHL